MRLMKQRSGRWYIIEAMRIGLMKALMMVSGFLLAVLVVTVPYIGQISAVERKARVKINNQEIVAELASNPAEIKQGLAGRQRLGINEGMLFLFFNKTTNPFWMKGMLISIDIIWIADGRIVGIEHNVPPQPDATVGELILYYPPEPIDQVLEVVAGRARLLRARVGDAVGVISLVPARTPLK
ncbi:MAG TPA: DUF192 domain-containing protein [Candidatus Jorgensenbacteria bacterium]|nr:DUF192 domain-containing protein [Candidatus Jorgensenbacteria bacterium]